MKNIDRNQTSLYQVVVIVAAASAPPVLVAGDMTYRDAVNRAVELSTKCSDFFVVAPKDMSASAVMKSCDSLPFAREGQFVFTPFVG